MMNAAVSDLRAATADKSSPSQGDAASALLLCFSRPPIFLTPRGNGAEHPGPLLTGCLVSTTLGGDEWSVWPAPNWPTSTTPTPSTPPRSIHARPRTPRSRRSGNPRAEHGRLHRLLKSTRTTPFERATPVTPSFLNEPTFISTESMWPLRRFGPVRQRRQIRWENRLSPCGRSDASARFANVVRSDGKIGRVHVAAQTLRPGSPTLSDPMEKSAEFMWLLSRFGPVRQHRQIRWKNRLSPCGRSDASVRFANVVREFQQPSLE